MESDRYPAINVNVGGSWADSAPKHTDLCGLYRGAPFQTPLDKFGGVFISTYYNYPLPKKDVPTYLTGDPNCGS